MTTTCKTVFGWSITCLLHDGLGPRYDAKKPYLQGFYKWSKEHHHLKSFAHSNQSFVPWPRVLPIHICPRSEPLVERPDHLFPTVIFSSGTFSAALGGLFVLGLIAAALSSADSALTSLTTCFQVDILQDKTFSSKKIVDSRQLCLTPCCHHFRLYYAPNGESIINRIFTVAQYTYGPLLGLFLFAMSAKRKVKSIYIPILCMLTIGLTLWCQLLLTKDLNFSPGFLLLGINGTIMYSLLVITSTKDLSYEKINHGTNTKLNPLGQCLKSWPSL